MSTWHQPAAWCCMYRFCDRGHPAFSHALRPYSVTWHDDRPGTRSRVGVDFCSWECAQRWVMEQRTDATAATLAGCAAAGERA